MCRYVCHVMSLVGNHLGCKAYEMKVCMNSLEMDTPICRSMGSILHQILRWRVIWAKCGVSRGTFRAFRLITLGETQIRKQTKLPMKQLTSTVRTFPGGRFCSQEILSIRHGSADTGAEDIAIMSLIQSTAHLPMVKKTWWALTVLMTIDLRIFARLVKL